MDYIENAVRTMAKMAITSRMARVPLEQELPRFLGHPVRIETFRSPQKITKLQIFVGTHKGQRFISDQRSKAIEAAARTLIRRTLSEVALEFVINSSP
jgi:hypothetical protein